MVYGNLVHYSLFFVNIWTFKRIGFLNADAREDGKVRKREKEGLVEKDYVANNSSLFRTIMSKSEMHLLLLDVTL